MEPVASILGGWLVGKVADMLWSGTSGKIQSRLKKSYFALTLAREAIAKAMSPNTEAMQINTKAMRGNAKAVQADTEALQPDTKELLPPILIRIRDWALHPQWSIDVDQAAACGIYCRLNCVLSVDSSNKKVILNAPSLGIICNGAIWTNLGRNNKQFVIFKSQGSNFRRS